MAEAATVAIPNDVIQPIVQARIQAAIVESLGKQADLIGSVVAAALSQKVTASGEHDSRYSYENKYTLLEALTNKYIREAAHEALKAYLQGSKETIKARVKKELEKKSSLLAAALVDGLANAVDTTYGINITVSLKDRER
jgi:hexokinase